MKGTETTMGIVSKLFGPSRDEVWSELCRRIDARRVDSHVWSGVVVRKQPWTILLDVAKLPPGAGKGAAFTRVRAFYWTMDGLKFTLYRSNWLTRIAIVFGRPIIKIGDPAFDRSFVILGNDEEKVRALFSNPTIRGLVQTQPEIVFEVTDDTTWLGTRWPAGVVELSFRTLGVIYDVERLVALVALFAETLKQLGRIGSARETSMDLGL